MTDLLAHSKAFAIQAWRDKTGIERYYNKTNIVSNMENLPKGLLYLYETIILAFLRAIAADEPTFDGVNVGADATTNAATKAFATQLTRDKQAASRMDLYNELDVVFVASGDRCFYDDLIAAIQADDPTWSPTLPTDEV